MRRSEIFAHIAKDITERLKAANTITNDEHEDMFDCVSEERWNDWYCSVGNWGDYESLARLIGSWDGANDDEITTGTSCSICTVPAGKEHYFRDFQVFDDNTGYACITLPQLFQQHDNVSGKAMNVIERIWILIHNNSNHKDTFWNAIHSVSPNQYIMVTSAPATTEIEKWRLFSYGYLLFVNKESHPKPPSLNFTDQEFCANISFEASKPYEQFYDVYTLINQSHHCNDILTRYLNMYQILENMCYRRHLAEITQGQLKRNKFIRNTIKVISQVSKTESEEIPKIISQLFPDLNTVLGSIPFTSDAKNFFEVEYGISIQTNSTPKTYAKLLYQIRNSIAHNKASELHFSFLNVDEYQVICDTIKEIINKMEPKIIGLINTPASSYPSVAGAIPHHPLEYGTPTMDLF